MITDSNGVDMLIFGDAALRAFSCSFAVILCDPKLSCGLILAQITAIVVGCVDCPTVQLSVPSHFGFGYQQAKIPPLSCSQRMQHSHIRVPIALAAFP